MGKIIKVSLLSIIGFAIILGIVGTLLNGLVMIANDGKMPVKVFNETGVLEDELHIEMTDHTKLNFLGDVILINVANESSSVFRKMLAFDHPIKVKIWGEGLAVCHITSICVASIGDVLRWIFALLMSIFFIPFTFATGHEWLVVRRRK